MYPPPFPQPNISAIRGSHRPQVSAAMQSGGGVRSQQQPVMKVDGLSEENDNPMFMPPGNASTSFATNSHQQQSGGFEGYGASPTSTMTDSNRGVSMGANSNVYYPHSMPYQAAWGGGSNHMDSITFNSQDIDIGALGLQQPELMGPWLDYIPGDVLGLFDQHDMGHGGQGGAGGANSGANT